MKKLVLTLAAILTFCCSLTATGQETGNQFSIATLNVDGLPQKILMVKVNAEGPGNGGTARIGKYLLKKGYDLVMLQEDFNYHDVLSVILEDDYKMDQWTGDVDVVGHTIDYLHLQNHRFECDGLMACWKNDLTVAPAVRIPWQQNFGKFSHALDEMVTKDNPPTLLIHAADDRAVNVSNSVKYFSALQQADVKNCSLHIFPFGRHSISLRSQPGSTSLWPTIAEEWMKEVLK